jgi:DNA-binding response OmpR family regulator
VSADPDGCDAHAQALAPYFEVQVVGSGAGALELLLVDHSIKLVLCAAQTLDVTACEFLQNMSWMVPGPHPPVIVFGEASPSESVRALELGAVQCFPESCGPKTLAREVNLLLRSNALDGSAPRLRPSARIRRRTADGFSGPRSS